MQPKVSVIIPCYGVEAYLDRCVESVLAQTLQDFEIILVDDGSPDRVPAMCDAWAARDARIRVIHKQNAGLGMACNSGLDVARGTYVAFLDSDDWVDADMYETLHQAAEQYQAQMVLSGLRRVDRDGNFVVNFPHKETLMCCRGKEEIDALACDMVAADISSSAESCLQMSAKVILYCRKTIEAGCLRFVSEREVISEDLHFNLAMMAHSECVCVLPRFFYNYRWTDGSLSLRIKHDQFEKIKILFHYTLKECEQLNFPPLMIQRVKRMFIGYTRQYMRKLVRSSMSWCEKKNIIAPIVNDSVWEMVWHEYPLGKMPMKHRLYARLLRLRWTNVLMLMLRLR